MAKSTTTTSKRRPKWQTSDGRVTMLRGDALDLLPKVRCDVVITSPPYNTLSRIPRVGSGCLAGSNFVRKVRALGYDDDQPEDVYQGWLTAIIRRCLERAKGLVWLNHKMRYRDRVGVHPLRMLPFEVYAEVIWSRCGSFAFNNRRFATSHEYLHAFGKPHWWNQSSNRLLSVWQIPARPSADHPCPFPLEIPRRLVEASCPPGGVVCDPFCGSATTGVATLQLGRRFIGIEKDHGFFELSIERLKEARRILRRGCQQ